MFSFSYSRTSCLCSVLTTAVPLVYAQFYREQSLRCMFRFIYINNLVCVHFQLQQEPLIYVKLFTTLKPSCLCSVLTTVETSDLCSVLTTVEPLIDVDFNYSRTSYLCSVLTTVEPLIYVKLFTTLKSSCFVQF